MPARSWGWTVLLVILPGACQTMVSAKTGPTFYDGARLQVMRENLVRYEWARQYRDNLLEGDGEEKPRRWWNDTRFSVRRWAERDDEFFWRLMPSTRFTKKYPDDRYGISPRHGTAVRQGRAFYHPWNYDPFTRPYKIQDPIDGIWYPSNDFASGDMTTGDCPDDGNGMVIAGERYFPIREYSIATYLNTVVPLMRRLSEAYLLTGDKRLAHKCAVLLCRVADEYPNSTDKADRCQNGPWGRSSGLVTDYIWETFKLTSMALSYDALYDHLGEDQELVAFLQAKGVSVKTPQEVRAYIEEHVFRVGMQALVERVIWGNEGHHQETAMTLALVMDDHDPAHRYNSKELVDWCMYGEGQMAFMMNCSQFRDGGGFESPNYNTIHFDFINAALRFEQLRKLRPEFYRQDAYPDIFAQPKARAMFDYFIDIVLQGRFTPSIGDDGGGTLVPERHERLWSHALGREHYLFGFQKYGDPRYARVLLGEQDELPPGDPFEPYQSEPVLEAARRPEAQMVERSRVLDGYGVAVLTSGEGEQRRALCLNYSNHFHHYQYDNLNLGLYHDYVDHLPDLGYPYTWEYRWEWDSSLLTHNTVTVNETPGTVDCPSGHGFLLAEAGPMHAVSAAHDPYMYDPQHNPEAPPVDRYERTSVLVDVSAEEYYVVDLFLVRGGQQHDQSWHGPICPVERPPLDWKVQPGTVAGPEVSQFAKWTDRWGKERRSALSFLTNVSRATASQPASFTWQLGLEHNNRLRLTVVPVDGPVELILSNGRSPARPPDWKLDYLFVRRTGPEGLLSRFLTVLDTRPGQEPTVSRVEVIKQDPLTLRVTHSHGVDQLVMQVQENVTGEFASRGLALSLSRADQTWQIGQSYRRGTITACDYAANAVTVSGMKGDNLQGRYVRVFTERRSSLYRILQVEPVGPDQVRLHLDATPLLFDVLVTGFENGKLRNGAKVQAWTEREDDSGNLIPWRIWNADAAVVSEDGTTTRRVEATPAGQSVRLADSPSAERLRAEFTDTNGDGRIMAHVYDYAVGATVETPETIGPDVTTPAR